MSLFKLALSGIRHNIRNYTMYFAAMCFCVFTIYTFSALALSQSVAAKLEASQNYQSVFIGFGIAIMVFVFFFLLSSNKSFIRYRKREISTYALFGMSNAKLAWLLFLDTLIIGISALAAGIMLGIFFSKLMVMLLLKMIMTGYSDNISFEIHPLAVVITSVLFFLVFIVMGLSGRRLIGKFQLVDLFKGEKVSEGKTRGSMALLIISILLIALGYFISLLKDPGAVLLLMILVIAIVVTGTYLFFSGGLQKVLSLIKRNKKHLYKKSRLISVSLFSHKSKTMAGTMGTIAVLVAVATTAIAFGYTVYQSVEGNAVETFTFDTWYVSSGEDLRDEVTDIMDENGVKIIDEVSFKRYVSSPETVDIPQESVYFFEDDKGIITYSESMYNLIASTSLDSNNDINVQTGHVCMLYPNFSEDSIAKNFRLSFAGKELKAQAKKMTNTYSFGGYLFTLVLDDNDFDELICAGAITQDSDDLNTFTGINYENALSDEGTAASLTQLLSAQSGNYRVAYDFYMEQMQMYGLLCFIGYFLCAVFILMSASMLYFKQIVIGTEEKKQYVMLRKIGMSAEEEKKTVRGRLVPVFFVPLVLGLMHSLFAMKAADTMIFSNIIATTGSTYVKVLLASLVMYAIYTVIYTFFYLLTKSQYTKTIR